MENYISIDIGTKNIKIIWVSKSVKNNSLKIMAKKSYPCFGVSFGYINDSNIFLESFREAVKNFQKENGIKIEEAFFSLNGFGVEGSLMKVSQQTANNVITQFEIESSQKNALKNLRSENQDHIIEQIKIKTIIDSFEHYSGTLGLKATKFDTEFLFITMAKNSLIILENIIEKLNIENLGFFPAMVSSAKFSLSDLDKKLGCALIDIGEETTSIIIYENNKPIYYNVLKIGSKKITQKISTSEKIDFEKAEILKEERIKNKKTESIINEEIKNLCVMLQKELKISDHENILPGGIVLVGGGSKIWNIEKIFEKNFSIPVKKPTNILHDVKTDYHNAYGSVLLGIREESENGFSFFSFLKNLFKKISI